MLLVLGSVFPGKKTAGIGGLGPLGDSEVFGPKVLEVSPNVNVEVHIDKAPINVHPKCHRPFRWNNPTSLRNSTYTSESHLKFGSPLYYAFEGVRTSNPRREGFKIKKETPSKCDTLLGYLDGT